MSFPEALGLDPIAIGEHCGISFVPQTRGVFAVVVCNTSPRRIKVRVDFRRSTRHFILAPIVGVVFLAPMIIEGTIIPYRVRNIGLLGPDNGSEPFSYAHLFSHLDYSVAVFVENDEGVMIAEKKWKKKKKSTFLATASPVLLPTTLTNAWPSWFGNLQLSDFAVTKRDVFLVFNSSEERRKDVLFCVDEIAGGAAFVVSVVNKSTTPHHVVYKALCGTSDTEEEDVFTDLKMTTTTDDANYCSSLEDVARPIFCVPMGHCECKSATTLEGYVPGRGDVGLGFVVMAGDGADVLAERGRAVIFHKLYVTACDFVSPEAISLQCKATCANLSPVFVGKARRPAMGSGRLHTREKVNGGLVHKVLLEREATYSRHEESSPNLQLSLHQQLTSFADVSGCLSFSKCYDELREFSAIRRSSSTDMVAVKSSHLAAGDSLLMDDLAETKNTTEDLELRATRESNTFSGDFAADVVSRLNGVVDSTGNVDTQSKLGGESTSDQLAEQQRTPTINSESPITMVKSALLEAGEVNGSAAITSPGVPSEESMRLDAEKKKHWLLDASFFTSGCIAGRLKLEIAETLERISIKTMEMTEWKSFLAACHHPLCRVCGEPILEWAPLVEGLPNGEKVHFWCCMPSKE